MRLQELFRLGNAVFSCKLMQRGLARCLPYRINHLVTNMCNSRCLTCNVWKIYEQNPKLLEGEMKIDEYDRMFKGLPDLLWFNFAGGEPFLRNDLAQILCSAVENCGKLMVCDTSTNGLMPGRIEEIALEIMEDAKPSIFSVGVSLDGVEELNNKIRGVKGDYKRALETYRRLRELAEQYGNFLTHINYTISAFNVGRLGDFVKELNDEGLDIRCEDISVSIANVGVQWDIHDTNAPMVINNAAAAFKDIDFLLQNTSRGLSLTPNKERYFIKRIFLNLAKKYLSRHNEMVLPCAASFASTFVDAYSNVNTCLVSGIPLGSLRENDFSFKKIWFSKKAKEVRQLVKEGKCLRCWNGCESWGTILQNLPMVMRYSLA